MYKKQECGPHFQGKKMWLDFSLTFLVIFLLEPFLISTSPCALQMMMLGRGKPIKTEETFSCFRRHYLPYPQKNPPRSLLNSSAIVSADDTEWVLIRQSKRISSALLEQSWGTIRDKDGYKGPGIIGNSGLWFADGWVPTTCLSKLSSDSTSTGRPSFIVPARDKFHSLWIW